MSKVNILLPAMGSSQFFEDSFYPDEPLIVANCDHVIDHDIQKCLDDFAMRNLDCALLCFKSIPPCWSYILTEGDDVVQVAEKVPCVKGDKYID